MRRRMLVITAFVIWSTIASRAGGPAFVAGQGMLPALKDKPWSGRTPQCSTSPTRGT